MPNDTGEIFWQKLSWKELENRLPSVETVLVPCGSVEQHGPHLAMENDSRSAAVVCEEVAKRMYPRVLVAPHFLLGFSPHMISKKFPGTITLRAETFIDIVLDIAASLQRNGIRSAICVNGHGGNIEPLVIAARRAREELGFHLISLCYWDFLPSTKLSMIIENYALGAGHGGEFETSIALARFSENVKTDLIPPAEVDFSSDIHSIEGISLPVYADEFYRFGATDNPRIATAAKGQQMFDLAVSGLLTFIEKFVKFEPKFGWHARI